MPSGNKQQAQKSGKCCGISRKKGLAFAYAFVNAVNLTPTDPQQASERVSALFAKDGVHGPSFGPLQVGPEAIYNHTLAYGTGGYETDQKLTIQDVAWDEKTCTGTVLAIWSAKTLIPDFIPGLPANTVYSQSDVHIYRVDPKTKKLSAWYEGFNPAQVKASLPSLPVECCN